MDPTGWSIRSNLWNSIAEEVLTGKLNMFSISNRYLIIFAAAPLIISCKKNSYASDEKDFPNTDEEPRIYMSQALIPNKYEKLEILEIPSVVEMNDEERLYVIELISSVRRVIDGSSSLEIEEAKILGKGDFFWPKDPDAPVMLLKFYSSKNFRIRGISIEFSRENKSKP